MSTLLKPYTEIQLWNRNHRHTVTSVKNSYYLRPEAKQKNFCPSVSPGGKGPMLTLRCCIWRRRRHWYCVCRGRMCQYCCQGSLLQLVWVGIVCVDFEPVGSEFCRCCLIVVPVVAPSDIGGGGGNSRELTITWTVGLDFPPGTE